MRAGRPRHQPRARHRDAQRQPRRNPLRNRHHVRLDAGVLDREHLARAPHPRLHFVHDEQDAVLLRQLAQPLQELIGRHDVAALALDRLDHDRRDFVGRHQMREQLLLDEIRRTLRRTSPASSPSGGR